MLSLGGPTLKKCSVIYKFVTTNKFNCHGTIGCYCIDLWINIMWQRRDRVVKERVTGCLWQESRKYLGNKVQWGSE